MSTLSHFFMACDIATLWCPVTEALIPKQIPINDFRKFSHLIQADADTALSFQITKPFFALGHVICGSEKALS